MSLAIEQIAREEVVILTLRGKLTFRESDSTFERIQALRVAGHLKVVLDLTRVHYVDSTGLGAIVGGYTSLTKARRHAEVGQPQPAHHGTAADDSAEHPVRDFQ
jgi:anti-anti-sigma factor